MSRRAPGGRSSSARPAAKRQPFHRWQRSCVENGQSNRFERIGSGTSIFTPPSASISCSKLWKSTTTMWLTWSPVKALTVCTARFWPPNWYAALIFAKPWPGTSTRRSRGIDRNAVRPRSGSVRTSMIESERCAPSRPAPGPWSVPSSSVVEGSEMSSPLCSSSATRPEALVRAVERARQGEVARERPDEHQEQEDDDRDPDAAGPAAAAWGRRPGGGAGDRAVRAAAVAPRRLLDAPLQRNPALRPAAAIDAVRLVSLGHRGGYRSRALLGANRVIGVDLGGTKIAAGLVDRSGKVESLREVPTPPRQRKRSSARSATRSADSSPTTSLRSGSACRRRSTRRRDGGVVGEHPAHRRPAPQADRRAVRRAGGIDNDANAAAIGEWHAGAGKGTRDMIMLTLGTGVGGGLILDGRPYRGARGAAAELGHIVIEHDGRPCQGSCTGRGHLEAYRRGSRPTADAQAVFGAGRRHAHVARSCATTATSRRSRSSRDRPAARLGARLVRQHLQPRGDRDRRRVGRGRARAAARAGARGDAAGGAVAGRELVRVVPAELGPTAGVVGAGVRRRSRRSTGELMAARRLRDADRQPRRRHAARARRAARGRRRAVRGHARDARAARRGTASRRSCSATTSTTRRSGPPSWCRGSWRASAWRSSPTRACRA